MTGPIDQLRIIAYRNKISQEEIARRTGMKQQYISKIFNGKHSPTVETLQKIADALGAEITVRVPLA